MFRSFRSPVKKSSVAKTLQFDSDPHQDVNSEGQSVDHPVAIMPSSLQPLIGQIAETAEEKYRLLEQRDKILRQGKYMLLFTCTIFQLFLFYICIYNTACFFCSKTKEIRLGPVQSVCGHMSRYVPREGALHERNP